MQEKETLGKRLLTNLIKWVIGVAILILIPVILPIGAALAIVYYIPVTIGGWIYNWIMKL